MPTKWKIFRVVAIVQTLCCFLLIALLCISLMGNYKEIETFNFMLVVCFVIIFLILFIFPLLNIYILQKNYPDNLFSSIKNNLFSISLVFYIIASLLLIVLYFYGFYQSIKDYNEGIKDDYVAFQILAALTILIFTIIYILISALKLKKLIQNNAAERQLAEIENFFIKQQD